MNGNILRSTVVAMYELAGTITAQLGKLPSGDAGTRATIGLMQKLAQAGAKDPVVRLTAINAVRMSGAPEHDPIAQLRAVFRYVRDRVLFIGDVAGVETLQSPRVTIGTMAGDCDDRAVLLAALARSIGIRADLKFRVIAANPRNKSQFSHVYVVARVGSRTISLDPTYHTNGFGFEYPGAYRTGDFQA